MNLGTKMYKIYGIPSQNTNKVLYVLEELGVDYQFVFVNLAKGENKTEAFLKLNPVGKVPVLVHGEDSIFESGAICRYLANVENSNLYPKNKLKRAKVDQWLDFFSNHLGRWLSALNYEKVVKQIYKMGPADEKAVEEASKFVNLQMPTLNQWLANNPFLCGKKMSIADLFAYAYLEVVNGINYDMTPYPNIAKWMKKMSTLESIAKAKEKTKRPASKS